MKFKTEKELDEYFNSPKNIETGKMKADEYGRLLVAVRALEKARASEESASAAAPATSRTRRNFSAREKADIEKVRLAFDSAKQANDDEKMEEIIKSEAFSLYALSETYDLSDEYSSDGLGPRKVLQLVLLFRKYQQAMDLLDVVKARKLEARIAALESRPAMKYVGVWEASDTYVEGEFATHDGCMWACRESTTSRPGTDQTWQLCVKRGRDGRDRRDGKDAR